VQRGVQRAPACAALLGTEVAGRHAREWRAIGLEHSEEAQVRQCERLVAIGDAHERAEWHGGVSRAVRGVGRGVGRAVSAVASPSDKYGVNGAEDVADLEHRRVRRTVRKQEPIDAKLSIVHRLARVAAELVEPLAAWSDCREALVLWL